MSTAQRPSRAGQTTEGQKRGPNPRGPKDQMDRHVHLMKMSKLIALAKDHKTDRGLRFRCLEELEARLKAQGIIP